MNSLAVLVIISISLGPSQAQTIIPVSDAPTTVADLVTDPSVSPITEALAVPLNDTIAVTENDINDVLAFGDNVIFVISERLNSLPLDIRPVGERILADTIDGLQACESTLRQNGIIWEYKVCCSSYLRYGMSAFAGLAYENLGSGAGRPTLFFM